jgi:hypothetical protein
MSKYRKYAMIHAFFILWQGSRLAWWDAADKAGL